MGKGKKNWASEHLKSSCFIQDLYLSSCRFDVDPLGHRAF